ncbi:MAG: TonB-dependent siderophore receptor [Pseudomonadales bacterium]
MKRIGLSSGAALALLSLTVQAADVGRAADEALVEEIVVRGEYVINDRLQTATGLGLTVQETPQSVSIVTFQRIEDQDLRSLTDVVNNAPGISSRAYDSSRNAFSSRGFDVDNYQIDGVPVQWDGGSSAGETQIDTSMYERVEIVRGATGLLTGVGNPSASINLVRKHANLDRFGGEISARASRWNTYNVELDVGSALNRSGTIRGRTVLSYQDGNSYVDFAGNEKSVVYAVVDADLTEQTLLSVGASYQDNDPTASQWGGLPIFYGDGSRTDFARSATVGADWTYWATEHVTYFANLTHEFESGWRAELNVNRMESNSDMRLLYLYGSPDPATGLGMGAFPAWYQNQREQNDFGLRVNGTYGLLGRDHELVFGALISRQDFDYDTADADAFLPVGNFLEWDGTYPEPGWGAPYNFEDTSTDQDGYYAATRFAATDALKLVLGARVVDWERKSVSYGEAEEFGDDGVFVPYAGALYDVTDNHTMYASYTEIFKPQNAQDAEGDFIDPLTGINYEIGLKSGFFDDSLHTTITYFWTRQENLATPDPDFVPDPGNGQFSAYLEQDGVKSDGFEVEIVGDLTPVWQISASYTQFDATAEGDDGEANTVNTRFPRKLLRLFTTYDWNRLTVGGGVNWEGKSYTDVTNPATGETERASQDDYALVNLMARYQFTDRLSAQLNVSNLLDETYYSQIGFYTQLAYGEPRNFILHVAYEF